nr:unnamed protein product [Meloidogyne enterolobii]
MVDDENIKYINCVEGKGYNKEAFIESENSFNKPKEDSINYSLFYFEIKCIIEHDKNWFDFGLKNKHGGEVFLEARNTYIRNENSRRYKLPPTFSWNNGDVFGCGLVYPPNNKINELPYVFFTQNGKQLGN